MELNISECVSEKRLVWMNSKPIQGLGQSFENVVLCVLLRHGRRIVPRLHRPPAKLPDYMSGAEEEAVEELSRFLRSKLKLDVVTCSHGCGWELS